MMMLVSLQQMSSVTSKTSVAPARVLNYPTPPPRGGLVYEQIPGGVVITAPPNPAWGCGITMRLVPALIYAGLVALIPNSFIQMIAAAVAIPILVKSLLKMRWHMRQPTMLAVMPGHFVLDEPENYQRQRRVMPFEKVRALTAYLYTPQYNYVGIETIEGDLFFGHRCTTDEIRWLGRFALTMAGIPESQMKITRPGEKQHPID